MTERSSTVLDEAFGLAIRRWLARTPAERAAVQSRRRQLDWLMHKSNPLSMQAGGDPFVPLFSDPPLHSEQQMLGRLLQDARRPPPPPPRWGAAGPQHQKP